jgi:hypothetical protein
VRTQSGDWSDRHSIAPVALKSLKDEVEREAEAVVDRSYARGRFCATGELSTYLPVTIVSNAIWNGASACSTVSACVNGLSEALEGKIKIGFIVMHRSGGIDDVGGDDEKLHVIAAPQFQIARDQ